MKALKRLLVIILFSFILMPGVFAKSKTTTTTTTAPVTTTTVKTENVEKREDLVGNTVNVEQDLNRTSFIAGNLVDVKSKVDGLEFVAGNTVNVSGQSDYSFIAGNNVTVSELKTKDLFAAGSFVTINGVDARDIFAVGAEVKVTGSANSLYVAGETCELTGDFTNVSVSCDKLVINGSVAGTLKVNDDAELTIDETKVGNLEKYKGAHVDVDKKEVTKVAIKSLITTIIIAAIVKFVGIIVTGILFIAVFKATTKKIVESSNSFGYVAARFGIGFATLILLPIVSIILMITGVGALVGVIILLMYVLLILLSSVASILYFAKAAFKNLNNYVRFVLMAIIITIIKLIPIVGGLIGFILLCVGIGILLNALFSLRKEN